MRAELEIAAMAGAEAATDAGTVVNDGISLKRD